MSSRCLLACLAGLLGPVVASAQHRPTPASGALETVLDPVVQQAYLKASNRDIDDFFGYSVAASGETIVVGAPYENSKAKGVDGNQLDNSKPDSGAVYVFSRSSGQWIQQAYLKPSNTGTGDSFGWSVAISGDSLVVGAPDEDSNAVGVNGAGNNDFSNDSGAAYVFVRNGSSWTQQAYLKASNTGDQDHFGGTVAISGDTIVVGAYAEASNAVGVNGNQANNSSPFAGAAYVFVRHGTTWTQQAYLKASNTHFGDRFGTAVAVSGDTIVVGAQYEQSKAEGVNGDQSDDSLAYAGAAYVFTRVLDVWSQQAYLKASNTDAYDRFGWAVAVDGDTIVVAAPNERSSATGVDGNQLDESTPGAGAVYVFDRTGTTWSQQAYLKASNTGALDAFGHALDVSKNALVVGAAWEMSAATGVNGDQNDDSTNQAGAAYAFVRTGTGWSQLAYLKASNTTWGDYFGTDVAVAGDAVAVGASSEDGDAVGVNGIGSTSGASGSGAAYLFDLGQTPWTDLASGVAGSAGWPRLDGSGSLLPGTPGELTLSGAAPWSFAVLFISASSLPAPLKCGQLVPVPSIAEFSITSDASGIVAAWWNAMPAGLSGVGLWFQYAIDDAGAPCGVSLSNALRAEIP